ncbi:diguanylate cyclase [Idiomarina seosinensis]|uniref:GGDEF domain-containing protein n=1 Tax=Idiomarina seosinensis TaxID=281739 RepID=A0A432ZIX0_9GAMM|nr:diguanylate cyclase [Idiomarina seosinensis]RUO77834.1 GGDEF domain-containing protein [Idiomarina seosinensis]
MIDVRKLFVLFMLVLVSPFVAASTWASANSANLYLSGSLDEVQLTHYSRVLYDDRGQLSLADIQKNTEQFVPVLKPAQLHLGYYDGTVWLSNVITNTSDDELLKVLSFDYANLDKVSVYVVNENGKLAREMQSGSHVASDKRTLQNRHPSFPLTIPAKQTVQVYTKIESNGSLTAFHRLYSPAVYDSTFSTELFWISLYCGMLFALGLYNLLLFISLKQKTFLFYSLFVSSFLIGTLSMNGIGPQLFWDHSALNVNRVMAFGFCAAGFTATLFARDFLNLKQNNRFWYRVTYLPLFVSGSGLIGAILLSAQNALLLSDFNGLVAGVVLLSCGIGCLIKRVPGSTLFVIAWTLLLSGATIHALRNLGVLPTHFFTLYGMQIGSALEMILLSFAIAAKFNQLKQDKERAQEGMLTALKTNEEQLENRIAQRTYELEQMAKHDGLTNLFNRNGLNEILSKVMQSCDSAATPVTLFMLDVDEFKPINDNYGHDVGDKVLIVLADRIQSAIRDCDVAARFGGDEFIIVTDSLHDDAEITQFIERLQKHLNQPIQVRRDLSLTVSTSIGYYRATTQLSVNDLLKRADQAMYEVKNRQR